MNGVRLNLLNWELKSALLDEKFAIRQVAVTNRPNRSRLFSPVFAAESCVF